MIVSHNPTKELSELRGAIAKLKTKADDPEQAYTEADDAEMRRLCSQYRAVQAVAGEDGGNGGNGGDLGSRIRQAGFDASRRHGDTEPDAERRALLPDESAEHYLRTRGMIPEAEVERGFDRLRLGQFLRGAVVGAGSDNEMRDALSIAADGQGGFTVPTVLSARLIDKLRDVLATSQAGAQVVALESAANDFAKLVEDPVPGWRAENEVVDESTLTFERVRFEPKTLAVVVRASRELLQDSLNVESALTRALVAALRQELDRAALYGSGADNQPTGLVNMNGVHDVAHDASISNFDPIVDAVQPVLDSNVPMPGAIILHPREWAAFEKLKGTDSQPLQPPPSVQQLRRIVATKVDTEEGAGSDSSMFVGDWARLWLGIRSDVRIQVLQERYADRLQTGFLCWLRADVQAEHEEAFTKITGIQP